MNNEKHKLLGPLQTLLKIICIKIFCISKNALFVFALSAFLPRTLALIRIPDHLDDEGKMIYITPWGWLYQRVLIHIPGDPRIGSLSYAICVILFMWFICWWLNKRKIYIKV